MAKTVLSKNLTEINGELDDHGTSSFDISSGNGKKWASVMLSNSESGAYKVYATMTVTGKGTGSATIYRFRHTDLSELELAMALGTAYARAVDAPKVVERQQVPPSGIELDDLVKYVDRGFVRHVGFVADIYRSERTGQVRVEIMTRDGSVTAPADAVKVLVRPQ